MSDLKIDEEFLGKVAKSANEVIQQLEKDSKCMLDKDGDIFNRYMAFCRMAALLRLIELQYDLSKDLLMFGHTLGHEVFHTEEHRKNNWHKIKLEEHPFFVNEEDSDDESPAEIQEFLQAITRMMKKTAH